MMQVRTFATVVWCLTVTVLLGACAGAHAPMVATNKTGATLVAETASQPSKDYRFYRGDDLAITAVNRPELTIASTKVDPNGYIAYPYLGQVYVQDLTPAEVAERLARGLREGDYYLRPEISVSLVATKDQYVYVLGEVTKPGAVSISGSLTLLEALARAGGKTYDAEMSQVMWIRGRQSPPGVVKLDLRALGDRKSGDPKIPNLTMIPGDVLYVPDSTLVSVQRFMTRMSAIIAPVVDLERGILLYPDVADFLTGHTQSSQSPTIVR